MTGVDKLGMVGNYEFGYLPGENDTDEIEWHDKSVFFFVMKEKQKIANEWGNIYARLKT